MGLLTAAQAVPALAFGLPAGIWVDRVRRRPVLIVGQVVSMVALATIPLTAVLGVLSMTQLYAVSFCTGTAAAFTTIAQNAFLPTLAGRDNLVDANAKYQTSMTTASLVGPGLAGFAVQVLTAPIAIGVDALSFLVGALTTAWSRVSESISPPVAGRRLRHEVVEGLSFVTHQPQYRSILLTLFAANWAGAMNQAVWVLVLVGLMGLRPAQIGLLAASGSIFSLLGAQLAGRIVARFGVGNAMAASAAIFGLGQLTVIPAIYLHGTTAFVWMLATGLSFSGLMIYNVNQQAIRGSVTPTRLLGRANSAVYVSVVGGRVLFALIGGALGVTIGLRPTFILGSALGALSAFPAFMPALRTLREVPKATD
jgi:MFS family permease